jgi:uncharacterized membrane protein
MMAKEPNQYEKLEKFYRDHLLIVWLLIIFVPLTIITIGWLVLPEYFYDQFVWRYFWGTIEADAAEESYGEVTEAYNSVNTITYAIIVIIALYWIYKLFKKFQIEMDFKFFLAIIPFIIVGGISRALEDAELFYTPTVYLFIAPIIYIFLGLLVIGFILIAVWIRKFTNKYGLTKGLLAIGWVFTGINIIFLVSNIFFQEQFSYSLNPIISVILSVIILLALVKYFNHKNKFEISTFLFSVGLWFVAIGLVFLAQWQTIPTWNEAYESAHPGKDIQLQPFAFILVCVLTLLFTFIVFVIAKFLSTRKPQLLPFTAGVNLILFFGHFLDASATFIAIDYYGYVEKHVLPVFLIDIFQTAAVMYLLKAIIIVLVVYFIDILYKKDFMENPTLTGLVKVAILVLGLGPGLRDILRLGIGV